MDNKTVGVLKVNIKDFKSEESLSDKDSSHTKGHTVSYNTQAEKKVGITQLFPRIK